MRGADQSFCQPHFCCGGRCRRAGRFDREISLGIPTEAARVKILQVISRRLRLEGNFDFHYVAKRTPGQLAMRGGRLDDGALCSAISGASSS